VQEVGVILIKVSRELSGNATTVVDVPPRKVLRGLTPLETFIGRSVVHITRFRKSFLANPNAINNPVLAVWLFRLFFTFFVSGK